MPRENAPDSVKSWGVSHFARRLPGEAHLSDALGPKLVACPHAPVAASGANRRHGKDLGPFLQHSRHMLHLTEWIHQNLRPTLGSVVPLSSAVGLWSRSGQPRLDVISAFLAFR